MNPRTMPRLAVAMLISLVAYVAAQAFIVLSLGPVADDLFLLQTTFDYEQFTAIMTAWTDTDRELFTQHFVFDFVHPFIYGAALCFAIAAAQNAAGVNPRWNSYVWAPFIASGCDVFENACYLTFHSIILDYPDSTALPLLFSMGNAFAAIKWTIAGLCLLGILVLWIRVLIRRVQRGLPLRQTN